MARLRWDADFQTSSYILGYLDRFEGIKEAAISDWLEESTEEDWIPEHRIKYVKNTDGEVVWDRHKRIDKVFGSGAGRIPSPQT